MTFVYSITILFFILLLFHGTKPVLKKEMVMHVGYIYFLKMFIYFINLQSCYEERKTGKQSGYFLLAMSTCHSGMTMTTVQPTPFLSILVSFASLKSTQYRYRYIVHILRKKSILFIFVFYVFSNAGSFLILKVLQFYFKIELSNRKTFSYFQQDSNSESYY